MIGYVTFHLMNKASQVKANFTWRRVFKQIEGKLVEN